MYLIIVSILRIRKDKFSILIKQSPIINHINLNFTFSGIGFAEFDDESLALYAIRYLNNMELVTNKGLIADYSLEDARALHEREKRLDKQRTINEAKKKEQRKEKKNAEAPIGDVVDLGKKGKKEDKVPVDQISDLELLHRMLRDSNSRGKKQRIKKRIDFLQPVTTTTSAEEVVVTKPLKVVTAPTPKVVEQKAPTVSATEKVQSLLKKRDLKIKRKEEMAKQKKMSGLRDEDFEIMKKVKGRKNDAKRARARETDEFDDIMAKYKLKVLKSIKKTGAKAAGAEPAFEEVEMSDY